MPQHKVNLNHSTQKFTESYEKVTELQRYIINSPFRWLKKKLRFIFSVIAKLCHIWVFFSTYSLNWSATETGFPPPSPPYKWRASSSALLSPDKWRTPWAGSQLSSCPFWSWPSAIWLQLSPFPGRCLPLVDFWSGSGAGCISRPSIPLCKNLFPLIGALWPRQFRRGPFLRRFMGSFHGGFMTGNTFTMPRLSSLRHFF